MPTVLDSFVLEFDLDPKKFTQGQREVMASLDKTLEQARKQGTEIESSTKKMFDLLSNLRREALAALSIFFGGKEVGEFVRHITTLDAATGRLATTIGISAEETSAWQGAIKQVGGTTEEANSALAGLSAEMTRFQLTGQSSMLPVLSRLGISLFDANHNLKTAGQLWLELADAVRGMDAREATAFLQMIPGATQSMINFALKGRESMESMLQAARDAGGTTARSAAEAQEYQRITENLTRSWDNFGRVILTKVAPPLTYVLDLFAKIIGKGVGVQSGEDAALIANLASGGEFGDLGGLTGGAGADPLTAARALLAAKLRGRTAPTSAGSTNEVEAYIRAAAASRGINPDIAVQVYRSEGERGYVGDHGTSFGPFQLHYGGGLGDVFTKQTGLHASDTSTWKSQVDFAMDQAKLGGWGPWHGWKGAPWAGIAPGGVGGGKATTINVGGVTVNTSSANGEGIANDIDGALRRSLDAGAANYGAQ